MAEQPEFIDQQYAFAAHIRDPQKNPAPADIEDRRLAIYRELFFNNAAKLLKGTFPVLYKILGPERWQTLIRDYYSRHICHTPLFLQVPKEFLDYLQNEYTPLAGDPAFLIEFAHYEWAELAVSIAEDEPELEELDRDGDLLTGIPVVSPVAWPLAYSYPVHQIGPDFQPEKPGDAPTFLVVYRDLSDKVGFVEINAVTAKLLEALDDNEARRSGGEILRGIAEEMQHPNPDVVVEGGAAILNDLRAKEIILGTLNKA
ncbi:MAG: putative DNA-binding domain-containing protein [Gammaproteobacteria bacterium]|nr:putative DNA-binding domain-containing protein [Gammaproteobacteria bacterium]